MYQRVFCPVIDLRAAALLQFVANFVVLEFAWFDVVPTDRPECRRNRGYVHGRCAHRVATAGDQQWWMMKKKTADHHDVAPAAQAYWQISSSAC
jgi:hypothetical protein